MIAITEHEFETLFENDADLYYLLTIPPASEEELIKYYLPSKLWRLNNLYSIVNKNGERIPFKMNKAQFKVYSRMLIHKRLIILKSRQQGISTFYLIDSFDDVLFRSHLSAGLMAQGREEASTLLERVKFCWENFDPAVKSFLGIKKTSDNASEFAFSNGSTIFIRTSFRSATLQRLHISEYGKICNESPKKAKETKTGTLQTLAPGNIGAIESTAEGLNDFKHMWDKSVEILELDRGFAAKDFYPVFLSWLDDPDCVEHTKQFHTADAIKYFETLEKAGLHLTEEQKNFWTVQYRELGGDIYQEYPATAEEAFRASRNGTYWANKYMYNVVHGGRVHLRLFDRRLPVYCSIDAGMHDYFVFCFFQVWEKEIRIIGEFWNNNESLDYYANYLLNEIPKDWKIEKIFVPHDFAVRDLSAKDTKDRQTVWRDLGITNTVLLDKTDLASDIELVRSELENMHIDKGCSYLESCFLNFSKEWDEKLQKWKATPVGDEFSHGAAAVRYMCRAVTRYLRGKRQKSNDVHDGMAL